MLQACESHIHSMHFHTRREGLHFRVIFILTKKQVNHDYAMIINPGKSLTECATQWLRQNQRPVRPRFDRSHWRTREYRQRKWIDPSCDMMRANRASQNHARRRQIEDTTLGTVTHNHMIKNRPVSQSNRPHSTHRIEWQNQLNHCVCPLNPSNRRFYHLIRKIGLISSEL